MSENGSSAWMTAVIGLGNPLMGDDGFGLRVLDTVRTGWDLPPGVELVDGGTWGLSLLPVIEASRRVLLIDAIETGAPAGTPVRLEGNAIPAMLATKLSPHHVDLHDVLALTMLRGTRPPELVAMGVQPAAVELGLGLSPAVEARVAETAGAVVRQLEQWGCRCRVREAAHA